MQSMWPFPRTSAMKEAGAAAITGLTALQGIDIALRLKRGEVAIIHGDCCNHQQQGDNLECP